MIQNDITKVAFFSYIPERRRKKIRLIQTFITTSLIYITSKREKDTTHSPEKKR